MRVPIEGGSRIAEPNFNPAFERRELLDEANEILDTALREKRDLTETEERTIEKINQRIENTIDAGMSNPSVYRSFGHFLQDVVAAERTGQQSELLRRSQETRAISGMGESVPAAGGFLVEKQFSNQLLRAVFSTGQLASRVTRIPLSGSGNGLKIAAVDETSRVNGSRWGGVESFWAGEGGTLTSKKPKFRQLNLELKKLTGLAHATDELISDASALETIIRSAFTEEFAFKLDDAIFRGDGVGKPLGIMNSGALVSVAKEPGQAAATVVYENLIKMWARLLPSAEGNSVWYINRNVLPQLFNLTIPVGTGGSAIFLPANSAANQPFTTLFGRPIVSIEHAESLGTKGDIVLADLTGGYVLIEKGGVQSAVSIHVKFENDESTFRFILRVDGLPILSAPVTPFKGSDTLSHFVTLDTRA